MGRKNRILIVLFASVLTLLYLWSCTYDYFEDETNYIVFVPEVLNNTVSDCRVLVYTADGVLVRERYAAYPWGEDPHIQQGLFTFHLPVAGHYQVFCYTNTDSVSLNSTGNLQTAYLQLNAAGGTNSHVQPSDVLFEKLTPILPHPGILLIDTAAVEKFTGRVTVRFKNYPGDATLIRKVSLTAEYISTHAYLKDDPLTTFAPDGLSHTIYHMGQPAVIQGGMVEVDHRYLPSVPGYPMRLSYTFLDASDGVLMRLSVPLENLSTGACIDLHRGQRIIIEIDTYTVIKISIVGWNEDIQSGGTNLE